MVTPGVTVRTLPDTLMLAEVAADWLAQDLNMA